MKYKVDTEYMLEVFKEIVETHSPVGYYVELNPVIEKLAKQLGREVTYDNRSTAYIILDGEDNSKTVLLGAHADTVGLMIHRIDSDGKIRVRALGGINYATLDGETVIVHTRDGRNYTGLFVCQSHSTHVFEDAAKLERNENTMMVLLDAKVESDKDVRALGIDNGDYVFIEPRCQITPNGYIKSRFIDDKGGIACAFAMLKYLTVNNLRPKYKTILAFPHCEEIGAGGAYIPEGVSEYVAVDIGLVGPGLNGTEHSVAICAKDVIGPYDYELTNRLIDYAKKAECDYAVDVFFRYATDASAALKSGNDIRHAAFGMPVYGSHGMERTHISGFENTVNLMLAYVLDI